MVKMRYRIWIEFQYIRDCFSEWQDKWNTRILEALSLEWQRKVNKICLDFCNANLDMSGKEVAKAWKKNKASLLAAAHRSKV